jgi:adenylate cyclase
MALSGKSSLQVMLKTVLLTSLVLTVPILGARWFGWFESSELAAYDDFIRRRPAEKPDDRIVIVTVGDEDIEALQQYPIYDSTFATMLEKLESYQPRSIGLDMARDIPYGPPAGRKRLTQIIKQNDNIFSGCFLSDAKNPGSPPAPGTPDDRVVSIEFLPDLDKTKRQVSLVAVPGKFGKPNRTNHLCNNADVKNEIPALSLALASVYLEDSGIKIEPDAKGDIQLGKKILHRLDSRFGGYVNADTHAYSLMLNYRSAKQAFREVSILDILNGKISPQSIQGRIVLIGNTSDVSKDFLSTPIESQTSSRDMYGVVAHAHAVSQILSAVLDQRPLIQSWSEPGEVLWIWVWSLGSGLIAFYNRRLGFFLIGVIITGGALWGICYGLFLAQGLWIPLVPTMLTAILTALSVRVVDLAERSGYAQAFYEQLQEQIRGNAAGRDRRGDYLESLVRRARVARQGQDAAALLALAPNTDLNTAASPTMQALYDKVSQQVRQELEAEQLAQKTAIGQAVRASSSNTRLKTLLTKAQQSRTRLLVNPMAKSPDHNSPSN